MVCAPNFQQFSSTPVTQLISSSCQLSTPLKQKEVLDSAGTTIDLDGAAFEIFWKI